MLRFLFSQNRFLKRKIFKILINSHTKYSLNEYRMFPVWKRLLSCTFCSLTRNRSCSPRSAVIGSLCSMFFPTMKDHASQQIPVFAILNNSKSFTPSLYVCPPCSVTHLLDFTKQATSFFPLVRLVFLSIFITTSSFVTFSIRGLLSIYRQETVKRFTMVNIRYHMSLKHLPSKIIFQSPNTLLCF